jgi:hexokinase
MAPSPRTRTVDRQAILDDLQAQFILSKDELLQLTSAFLDEIRRGLNNYGHPMAMMYAFSLIITSLRHADHASRPTFVTGVPDGTETGCVVYPQTMPRPRN